MKNRSHKKLVPFGKSRRLMLESLESRKLCAIDGTAFSIPEPVAKHGGSFAPGQTGYADVSGDGKADMIFQGTDNQFWLSLSTGTGFSAPRVVMTHGGRFVAGQASYADVDGDRRADMIFRGTDNRFWLSLSTGQGFSTPRHVFSHGGSYSGPQVSYADVNGDGRADMIYQGTDNKFWLSYSTGNGFTQAKHVMTHGGRFSPGQASYADINGDRMADMIFQGADNKFWLSMSNARGFTTPIHVMTHGGPFRPGQAEYSDINGDGKADMIFQGADNQFWLSLSNGVGFKSPELVMKHGGPFLYNQTGYADVTGDGKGDMIFQGEDNTFWLSKGVNSIPLVSSNIASDLHLNMIGAPSAWAQGFTGKGVLVAVLDTGVQANHSELRNRVLNGYDFAAKDFNPNDEHGHGTHVAGIIASSRNGIQITGAAYESTILAVRVLGKDGKESSVNSVAKGIRYAVDHGAKIINLSLGNIDDVSTAERNAIAYASSKNVLIVASAGNQNPQHSVPANFARLSRDFDNVISVGNFDSQNLTLAANSQRVGDSRAMQVDAPGENILSAWIKNDYAYSSGTSMAAPFVSGLAALALSANPSLTAAELKSAIIFGANQLIRNSDASGGINVPLTIAIAVNSRGGSSFGNSIRSASDAPGFGSGGATTHSFNSFALSMDLSWTVHTSTNSHRHESTHSASSIQPQQIVSLTIERGVQFSQPAGNAMDSSTSEHGEKGTLADEVFAQPSIDDLFLDNSLQEGSIMANLLA